MGILDRLKLPPRWRHSDPAVRLQAIAALDDPIELAALAERDPDVTVRKAAIAKLADVVVLGRVAAAAGDLGVRDAAADRLLALAVDGSNPEAATALGLVSDARRVSAIAKSAATAAVREAALAGLTDERALGGVARRARVETTALAAAARLTSVEELLSTVLNSEHRDVALAALDRLVSMNPTCGSDGALLESIAARARQKAVARRAREMLGAIEAANDARRVAADELRTREAALCVGVERLARGTDPDSIAADVARMSAAWDALAGADPAATRRFAAGVEAARARMTQRRGEIEAAREATRRREEALGSREELCRRAEAVAGGDVLGSMAAIEAEWARLPPLVGYEAEGEGMAARFAQAAAACRRRLAVDAEMLEVRNALDSLVAEGEALRERGDATAAARWRVVARGAAALVATLDAAARPASEAAARLAVVAEAFAARAAAERERTAHAKRDRLAALARLAVRAERTAGSGAVTLREGERLLRDIAAALEEAGRHGTTKEAGEIVGRLRARQETLARRVSALRDLDEWRRFGNVQPQEELIATAEALVASLRTEEAAGVATDVAAAAAALRELQSRWRAVADAPAHAAQRLWERFKAATDVIRSRCEVHFADVRRERSANLAARTALVEQAEALADSTDWSATAARLKALQKSWEDLGPAPGEAGRALARRFRAACTAFFARRRGILASKKEEWSGNLARKEALCERAEQLAASTDWDAVASELKTLQANWKAIGPVRHDQGEAVWKRFRSAADGFFARYHDRHRIAAGERIAEHAGLVDALEALGALAEAPADLAAQVQALRTALANAPSVEGAGITALRERWRVALAALVVRWPGAFEGTDLDPAAIQARLTRLIAKVERLATEGDSAPSADDAATTAALAARLRSALANNAMGVRTDDTKWRAAGAAVAEAREAWRRLALLPDEATGGLAGRFAAACERVMAQVERCVGGAGGGAGERDGRGPGGGSRHAERRGSRGRRPTRGAGVGASGGEGE
ncbi:MAG: DUF349 domain-containing protein [Deltaproteobacteria bacterium]|nr:DUF349 domain-containing protein [Deltaproteobacteria bacterium]